MWMAQHTSMSTTKEPRHNHETEGHLPAKSASSPWVWPQVPWMEGLGNLAMTRPTWGALWAILLLQSFLHQCAIWGASLEWCWRAGEITGLLAVYKATSPVLNFSAPFYAWVKVRFWLYLPPNLILLTSTSGHLQPGPDCHTGRKELLSLRHSDSLSVKAALRSSEESYNTWFLSASEGPRPYIPIPTLACLLVHSCPGM